MKRFILFIVLLVGIAACADTGPLNPQETRLEKKQSGTNPVVAFYLVKGLESSYEITNVPLDKLQLEEKPVFTSDDMENYDVQKHSFMLKDGPSARLYSLDLFKVFGTPFVVTVGERRIYAGAFWTVFSSYPWDGISIVSTHPNSTGELMIYRPPASGIDPRNDSQILEILKSVGKNGN